MRRVQTSIVSALLLVTAAGAVADPVFVNGLRFRGDRVDATGGSGPNEGRLGFFSDLYYDPVREDWWALSDRGPGGGVLDYATRVQKVSLDVDSWSGRISAFKVLKTIQFTDPHRLLSRPTADVQRRRALNGQNPFLLNDDASALGRSFDPEGFVIDPRSGHFLVADEYGPSLFEFDRKGRLLFVFETPAKLVPRVNTVLGGVVVESVVNYVALRDACSATLLPPNCGLNDGRQDNRGFEGLAVTPDGRKLYAVMQDPLVDEPTPNSNNGRNGRNLRIVVFDNDHHSSTFGKSIAQYAYPLEKQADVLARILAAGGTGSATDPRQGRNLGLSAIVALNDHEFLVLERDNRGIGVDNPQGKTGPTGVTGSKRVFKMDVTGATN
ncbi:MAG TPA: esterase-like activity of phytase family protein, partial [Vicinamibacteria bacterium]